MDIMDRLGDKYHFMLFELETESGKAIWHKRINMPGFMLDGFYETYLEGRFPEQKASYLGVCKQDGLARKVKELEQSTGCRYFGGYDEIKSQLAIEAAKSDK